MRWRSTSGSEWWAEVPSGEPGLWGRQLLGKRENKAQLRQQNRYPFSPAPMRERLIREALRRLPVLVLVGELRLQGGHAPGQPLRPPAEFVL